MFLNGLAHNRSKVSGSCTEIEGAHIDCSRSISSLMSNNHEGGCLDGFGVGQLLDFQTFFVAGTRRNRGGHFQNPICLREFETWGAFFQNLKVPK